MPDLQQLRRIAETEFLDVVQSTTIIRDKLRVVLTDGSYIDFWWSSQIPGRYAITGRGSTLTELFIAMTTCRIRNGKQ